MIPSFFGLARSPETRRTTPASSSTTSDPKLDDGTKDTQESSSNQVQDRPAPAAVINPYKKIPAPRRENPSTKTPRNKQAPPRDPLFASEENPRQGVPVPVQEAAAAPAASVAKPSKPTSSPTPLKRFLRSFASSYLPKVDNDGYAYTSTGKGSASKKNRTLLNGDALFKYLDNTISGRPILMVPHPRTRAKNHNISKIWTAAEKKAAMEEFAIPAEQRVIIVFPDLFDRDILKKHKEYRTKAGGILTPCPKCNSNMHVEHIGFTLYDEHFRNTLREDLMHDGLFGPEYECRNLDSGCAKYKKKDGKETKQILGAKFRTYTGDAWTNLPLLVKARYERYVSRIDDGGASFLSPEMCTKILYEGSNFKEMSDNLQAAYDRLITSCHQAFYQFTMEEATRERQTRSSLSGWFISSSDKDGASDKEESQENPKWPAFDPSLLDGMHRPMGQKAVKAVFWKVYNKTEPYLYRDLFSRSPGKFIRFDGTYAVMGRTMNDETVEEEMETCVKVFGEYGHCLSFAFSSSEADCVIQRLIMFIRRRILRLGGMLLLREVIALYSDTCCEELKDPSQHWATKIFPSVTRAPLKDLFHGVTACLRGFDGPAHPLHNAFKSQLWEAMLLQETESFEMNLTCYMQNEGKGLVREVAASEMMKLQKYRESIYNYTNPNPASAAKQIKDAFQAIAAQDSQFAAATKTSNRKYRRFVKPYVPINRSTSQQKWLVTNPRAASTSKQQ